MNGELTNAIDEIAEKFGIAIDWADKNALPYIQELMQRYRSMVIFQGVIAIIFCALIVISGIFLIKHICKADNKSVFREYDNDFSILGLITIISCVIAMAVCVPLTFEIISGILNWIFVPELQFAEKTADLLK